MEFSNKKLDKRKCSEQKEKKSENWDVRNSSKLKKLRMWEKSIWIIRSLCEIWIEWLKT